MYVNKSVPKGDPVNHTLIIQASRQPERADPNAVDGLQQEPHKVDYQFKQHSLGSTAEQSLRTRPRRLPVRAYPCRSIDKVENPTQTPACQLNCASELGSMYTFVMEPRNDDTFHDLGRSSSPEDHRPCPPSAT